VRAAVRAAPGRGKGQPGVKSEACGAFRTSAEKDRGGERRGGFSLAGGRGIIRGDAVSRSSSLGQRTMSDSASQVNELRLLEQKRLTAGLAPEEEARRAALSGAVSTPVPTRGFDVKAAAAQVRALLDPTAAPLAPCAARAPDVGLPTRAAPPAPAVADPTPSNGGALDLDLGALGAGWDDDAVAPVCDAVAPVCDAVAPVYDAVAPVYDAVAPVYDAVAPVYDAVAPVYDAVAYGLDPNDPNDASWAAWYAEQGWDPATAYAYALQLSAQGGGLALDGPNDPRAVHTVHADPETDPPDTAADVQAPLLGEAFAVTGLLEGEPDSEGQGSFPVVGPQGGEVVPELPSEIAPELPPMELGELDVPIAESVPLDALAPESDFPADLGLTFESEAARAVNDPPYPEVAWAELAVPASDQPVDFAAFDAEPHVGYVKEEKHAAETTALWDLRTGSQSQLPACGLPAGEPCPSDGPAFFVPGAAGDEPDGLGGVAGPVAEAPLEGELIELLDDDIIQVAEEVVDVAPPASLEPLEHLEPLQPLEHLEPLEPIEAVLLKGAAPPAAVGPAEQSAMRPVEMPDALARLSRESSLTFEAIPPAEPTPGIVEHASLAPADEVTVEPAPTTAPEQERAEILVPTSHVSGTHRVVIHTADGQVKRGTVSDLALDAGEVLLTCQAGGAAESVPVEHVKAIFFMLPAGEPPPQPEGKKVRVTFRDGRQVAGYSVDYAPERIGFFMVPADARTHTARIWVYRTAVRQVSVS